MQDLIIVGAGPSGLACAIAARDAGLTSTVVEQGGIADAIRRFPVNMTFFSTPELLEVGGIPFPTTSVRPSRQEVLEYYRRAAAASQLDLRLHTRVLSISPAAAGFQVETGRGAMAARNVVVATGYFDHTNRLVVPGEDLPHVSHYYDEPFAYAGCRVAVIGGRNSAVEVALDLFRHDADVTLIHRRPELGQSVKYWVRPDIENRIAAGAIQAYFGHRVIEIRESDLDIVDAGGRTTTVPADFVFAMIGYRPDEALLRGAGVELDDDLIPAFDPVTFETNVPGLYIAGSVACGCRTWDIFIENGREHGKAVVAAVRSRSGTA